MRISTQLLFNRGLDNIQNVTVQLQKTQLQISSGRKVQTPADDPVAATRILRVNQELEQISQYQRNINLAENRLKLEDSLLGNVADVLQRLRELAVQAGDGSQNADDKKFIASEIRQRLDQLAGIMNTRDASGEYIFGGFQGRQEPFVKDESGHYIYRGDEGVRSVQIDGTVSVAVGDNGKRLFEEIPSANKTFYTEANPNNQAVPKPVITQGRVIDQAAWDAFYPEDMVIEFDASTPPQYSIRRVSDGRPILSNQTFTSGQPISANGIQFEIVGNPAPGDTYFVHSSEKQGLLTTVERLADSLERYSDTDTGRQVLKDQIDSALANLTNAETRLLEVRAGLGARLNTIENTQQLHGDVEVLTKEVLSELQDVDFAEAVSQLTLQSTILQAAQQSYAQVTRLSLFDRL
ncbi:flagellar hook-associated protein FlgL [Hahella sp. SMD15-11]|uniref:Flagellar hook-associated protein FlgL n=1 Tax=Thermohahella caldifontis TaxID=3142973 RepID=A0AB39UZB1_9GAMM